MKLNWPLLTIVALYLIVGSLYAIYTPLWQVPDEPAHYNYVRALADTHHLPVMESGDYDQAYIERLTSEGFPAHLSVAALTYEDHQPPLYYLLATPVYWLSGGSLRVLRLFSLALGGVVVVMTGRIAQLLFPQRKTLVWLAAGLVAFIPQHVAMMAGVNNDALTEALLALWLYLALEYLRSNVRPVTLSLVGGALLLTKTTGYVVLPLSLVVLALRHVRSRLSWRRTARQALLLLIPTLLLGALWWGRNLAVYGWPDFLGLQRHNAVVVGQPRTADWIARDGLFPFLTDALRTTFRSFWGQFGWMGVVVDRRIYLAVGLLSALMLWGFVWHLINGKDDTPHPRHRDALILLGCATAFTFALPFWYNLTFVQHQGRYLFPALPALALAAALGLHRLAQIRLAVITALLLFLVLLVLGGVGLVRGDLPLWPMVMTGLTIALVMAAGVLGEAWHPWFAGLLLSGLIALDLWCLFGFIVPMLT
ncbi:MAG: glycosyltransferase family 39 protein [Anaerolineae bacterium]